MGKDMEINPFDDLLGLEEKFYDEGFESGTADGHKDGRIEGRVFGLEKGFEKYLECGRLQGRSLVWMSRSSNIASKSTNSPTPAPESKNQPSSSSIRGTSNQPCSLPGLSTNYRLQKHLEILYGLTEPASLSTENSEDAVSDFDDRFKRALGRVKMIERIVGEEVLSRNIEKESEVDAVTQHTINGAEANIEDVSILKARY